jgi:hypothetical protein
MYMSLLSLRIRYAQLAAISAASPDVLKTKYSLTASQRIIEGHWYSKKTAVVDQKCLAALAVLSAATSGQYVVAEALLVDALIHRRQRDGATDGTCEEDVRAVIQAVYAKAGALGSEWPESKDNKSIAAHGKKMEAYKGNKGKEKEARREWDMGADAAEALRPSRKGKEVDGLAGRSGRASVPDNRMPDSEEEEEEDDAVKKPGRIGGG